MTPAIALALVVISVTAIVTAIGLVIRAEERAERETLQRAIEETDRLYERLVETANRITRERNARAKAAVTIVNLAPRDLAKLREMGSAPGLSDAIATAAFIESLESKWRDEE
jgi:hypothetical protein